MKNKTFKCLMFLVMTIFMSVCFVGCPANDNRKALASPNLPEIIKNQTEFTVKTDSVENASGYMFEIGKTNEGEVCEYFSKTNRIDVKNIIVLNQSYQIRVKAIGLGEYKNSDYSETKWYSNKDYLETPLLQLNGTMLTWTNVVNNSGFEMKVNDSNTYFEFNSCYVDIFENQNIKNILVENSANTFQIRAKGVKSIYSSDFSNVVTYRNTSMLDAIQNLQVYEDENTQKVRLTWNLLEGDQVKYNVKAFNTIVETTASNEIEVDAYMLEAKIYEFSVQAVSENEFIEPSDWSEIVKYSSYKPFSAPKELKVTRDGENLILSWEKVDNALSYKAYINEQIISEKITDNKVFISAETIKQIETEKLEFYCVACENELFLESSASEVIEYDYYEKLSAPQSVTVQRINNMVEVSFSAVVNATGYTVMIDDVEISNFEATKLKIDAYLLEPKNYKIKVKANANSYFVESDFSAVKTFANKVKLLTPEVVMCEINAGKLSFEWNEVENATSYNVKFSVNNEIVEITNISSNNIEYLLSEAGIYYISVCANGSENYLTSEYSMAQNVKNVVKLAKASNLQTVVENNNLKVSWNAVKNATGYTVLINGIEQTVTSNSIKILIDTLLSGENEIIVIANSSNADIYLSSDSSTIFYDN